MKSKLKIAGLMVFVLFFALTMTACDTAMDTGSDVTEEVEETGELFVEADLSELSQLESEVETSDVSAQSTVNQRFDDYQIFVSLEHNSSGRVHEDNTEKFSSIDSLDTEFGFGNVLAGEWTLIVELKAVYNEDSQTKTIASAEEDVTVEAGKSNTLASPISVEMNDGELNIEVGIPEDAASGEMILKDADGDKRKIVWNSEDLNGANKNVNWTDLAPARAYTAELRFWDENNNLITEAKPIVHVLPGTVKSFIAEYFAGRNAFEFTLNLPPSKPTGVEITENGLVWDEITEESYIIARRELNDGRDYYEKIKEGAESPFVDDDQIAGVDYEYAVIAVRDGLTSDYSDSVSTVETVNDEAQLSDALIKPMISTIKLNDEITIDEKINLNRQVRLDGNGNVIKASTNIDTNNESTKHLLGMNTDEEITIKNITFDNQSNAYGLQAYKTVNNYLVNVTIKNSIGAGLTVNGSEVEAYNLTTNGNPWGAVNVDPGYGVTEESVFTLTGDSSLTEDTQIWSDGSNVTETATVTVNAGGYKKYIIPAEDLADFGLDHLDNDLTYWTNRDLEQLAVNDNTRKVYLTIQNAIDAATTGDTILVGPGTYKEDEINITKNNINLIGEGNPQIENNAPVDSQTNIMNVNADGVKIKGLTMKIVSSDGAPASVLNINGKDNIVEDSTFELAQDIVPSGQTFLGGTGDNTSYLENKLINVRLAHWGGADGIEIKNNTFKGEVNDDGLWLEISGSLVIEGNNLTNLTQNNTSTEVQFHDYVPDEINEIIDWDLETITGSNNDGIYDIRFTGNAQKPY